MDRGFEIMIPREKEEPEEQPEFDYGITFSLFGKKYTLNLMVQQQRREK